MLKDRPQVQRIETAVCLTANRDFEKAYYSLVHDGRKSNGPDTTGQKGGPGLGDQNPATAHNIEKKKKGIWGGFNHHIDARAEVTNGSPTGEEKTNGLGTFSGLEKK